MKTRSTQFGVRENTASSRRHAPRLAFESRSTSRGTEEENLMGQFNDQSQAASKHAATVEETRETGQLLTVHEVARLLNVPTSWVYERTRRRSSDQLPHVKLGKYLRFEETTIAEFIQRQRCA
jgi:excisionase family DNA binding protein